MAEKRVMIAITMLLVASKVIVENCFMCEFIQVVGPIIDLLVLDIHLVRNSH